MNLEDDIRRAEEALQILNHPLFQDAFRVIESDITQTWIKSPEKDAEGREKLWLSLKLLKLVRHQLETHINTGKLAARESERRGIVLPKWLGGS